MRTCECPRTQWGYVETSRGWHSHRLCTLIFLRSQNKSQRSVWNIVQSQQSSHYISLKFSVKSVKVKAKFQWKCLQLSDRCYAVIKNFRSRFWPGTSLVSRSQTQTDTQGLIACSISARAVRVWATDTARFALAAAAPLDITRNFKLVPLWGMETFQWTSIKVPHAFQPIDTHPISCGSQNKPCCVSCPDPNSAGAYTASDKALRVSLGLATRD